MADYAAVQGSVFSREIVEVDEDMARVEALIQSMEF